MEREEDVVTHRNEICRADPPLRWAPFRYVIFQGNTSPQVALNFSPYFS
jgi:hypothetical protein